MKNTLDTLSIKLAFNPFNKELRQHCFTMSKKYNKLRKAKRRAYYIDIMMFKLNSLSDTNPKAFWDLVNELKYENKSDKGTNLDAPTWENYFKKLNTLSTEKAVLNENFESLLETDRSKDLMNELDFPISAKEVTEATKKLKNGKSSGSDSILNEMLKNGNFVLQPCLVKLFNIILSSGIYPTEWVQGLIFPIYKTGDPLNPSNYRGIAITSCLSKLFNSILNARLEKYILKNELIRNEQIGFKAGCRTSDHIFKLKTIIDKYLNKSKKFMPVLQTSTRRSIRSFILPCF